MIDINDFIQKDDSDDDSAEHLSPLVNKNAVSGGSSFPQRTSLIDSANRAVSGGAISKQDPENDILIPNEISECSLTRVVKNRKDSRGNICFEDSTIKKLQQQFGGDSPEQIIQNAKQHHECDTQRCVLLKTKILTPVEAAKEMVENFKLEGPTNSDLLSNFNIDHTLQQWQMLFTDFYAYDFNMVDFKEHGKSLATTRIKEDIYDKGFRTFACVINSDYYHGQGKHWMALFGDMRSETRWTVEFFNSAGSPPQKSFAEWLLDTKNEMIKLGEAIGLKPEVEVIKASGVLHQYSRTECGVYSLYYIWARLHNISPDYFKKKDDIVSDIICFEFRQHLFNDKRHKPMEKFDYDEFEKFGKIKWEDDISKVAIETEVIKAKAGNKMQKPSSGFYKASNARNLHSTQTANLTQQNTTQQNTTQQNTTQVNTKGGLRRGSQIRKYSGPQTTGGSASEEKVCTSVACYGSKVEEVTNLVIDQILLNPEEKKQMTQNVDFTLQLKDDSPELPYRRRADSLKLSYHWGQRKLLMTEIFFLAKFSPLSKTVLYAGAAPGNHIPYLVEIFPNHKFILYDPRDFSPTLNPFVKMGKVEIHQEFMTDDVARKFKGKDVLFVSDIRTEPTEKGVHSDMLMQQSWHTIMNPLVSMFKFRLPYSSSDDDDPELLDSSGDKKEIKQQDSKMQTANNYDSLGDSKMKLYEYLAGNIFIQPWAPSTSTETRLLAYRFKDKPPMHLYDPLKYERQMFRHSLITRQFQNFKHCVQGEGIDSCWDCRAEIEILGLYLIAKESSSSDIVVPDYKVPEDFIEKNAKVISEMSRRISRVISTRSTLVMPPHGVFKNMEPSERIFQSWLKYRGDVIARKEAKIEWSNKQRALSRKIGLIKSAQREITSVFLMRHGESESAEKGLSAIGRKQAEEMGKVFSSVKYSVVFTSPAERCVQTAQIIIKENRQSKHLVPIVEQALFRQVEGEKSEKGEKNDQIGKAVYDIISNNIEKSIFIVGHSSLLSFLNYAIEKQCEVRDLNLPTGVKTFNMLKNAEIMHLEVFSNNGKITRVSIASRNIPIEYKLYC